MPLLTLIALKALLDLEALNSNNVRGGTCLAEAGGVKKSGSGRDNDDLYVGTGGWIRNLVSGRWATVSRSKVRGA